MVDRPEHDEERDAELTEAGWKVVRIQATDILKDVKAVAGSVVGLALLLAHHPGD